MMLRDAKTSDANSKFGVIFLIKRISIFLIVLSVAFVFIAPIGADPSDVTIDQQVELEVPGKFQLVDNDQNGKAEAINFSLKFTSYREGKFIATANLEANKAGEWTTVATTVIPCQWNPNNNQIKVTFQPGNIIKEQLNGAYRVNLSLKEGGWILPQQVVGFSEDYAWNEFENKDTAITHDSTGIASSAEAKRAAEQWAALNQLKLGEFLGVEYNYDTWNVEFHQGKHNDQILRFLVSPEGNIRLLKIRIDS
jgi:hypothetical protein